MAIRFGVVHLSRPLSGDHTRLPIDFLIRSLAEECGGSSVAIILSGTGNDGSGALAALHKSGGHIIVCGSACKRDPVSGVIGVQ
jgi:two-component system CheB/CheR fusion protein